MSQYALRLPEALHSDVKRLAEEQGVSMNHFLVYVITSKVSEMKASQDNFRRRIGGVTREQAIQSLKEFQGKLPVSEAVDPCGRWWNSWPDRAGRGQDQRAFQQMGEL